MVTVRTVGQTIRCVSVPVPRGESDYRTGPVVYLNFLGERVFVLNSQQAATDILEKNMNAYAGRPQNMVMASELYVVSPLPSVPSPRRH